MENYYKAYLRVRNTLGILGCLLPVISIIGALFSPNLEYKDWWTSISITYYSSPILIAVLSAVSLFLIVYRGYDIWDTLVNTMAGVCGLFVVCFPCEASWLDMSTRVGIFWLPISVTRWFHYISAFLLFVLLAINSICLFSKGKNSVKNLIYKICGYVIITGLVLFALTAVVDILKPAIIGIEALMLFAFGFSWIVKGHMLDGIFGE